MSDTFDLKEIFNKRAATAPVIAEPEEVKSEAPAKEDGVKKKKKEPIEEDEEEEDQEDSPKKRSDESKSEKIEQKAGKNRDDDEDDNPKEKVPDYKIENERLQRTLRDTQKSFHEDRKKLSAYKKTVNKFIEDGVLTEDEAQVLLDHTQFEGEVVNESKTVIVRYGEVWDKEIKNMVKYNKKDAPHIEQCIRAFQHMYDSSSLSEREDILDDLSNYEDDEVEFTNRMLALGSEYNDDVYSDLKDSGGIRNVKAKYQDKIDDLQKDLDKMTEKYNKLKKKHSDYDAEPANLRISSGAAYVGDTKNDSLDFGKMFKDKFHRR